MDHPAAHQHSHGHRYLAGGIKLREGDDVMNKTSAQPEGMLAEQSGARTKKNPIKTKICTKGSDPPVQIS